MAPRIAVVGAGMAGTTAAATLGAAGAHVTILEKSRGPGGRMATRRGPDVTFDHGAPHICPQDGDTAFAAAIEGWVAENLLAPWGSGFVGMPGMPAIARGLIEGLPLLPEHLVTELARTPEGWTLAAETEGGATQLGPFDAVLFALPAPQILRILGSGPVAMPELDHPTYAPGWTLMSQYPEPLGLPDTPLQTLPGPVLATLIRNGTKPGRSGEALVVHADPAWAEDHLEIDRDAARDHLLTALAALVPGAEAPTYATAHRWRFARVTQALGEPFVWRDGIGLAGDWCLGPNVADAYTSGRMLAAKVLETL